MMQRKTLMIRTRTRRRRLTPGPLRIVRDCLPDMAHSLWILIDQNGLNRSAQEFLEGNRLKVDAVQAKPDGLTGSDTLHRAILAATCLGVDARLFMDQD